MAHDHALQLKQAGFLDRLVAPSMLASPSDWQQQSKNRESYAYFRSWVYAAINVMSSEAASQPVRVGKLKGAKEPEEGDDQNAKLRKVKYAQAMKRYRMSHMTSNIQVKAAERELEVMADHSLIKLLDKPNPIQDRYQFVYNFVANLNLTGRAYIIKSKTEGKKGKGKTKSPGKTEYYSLPSTWVRPDHTDGPYSKFYVANPRDLDFSSKTKPLDASQVAMAHLPNPADPMGAMSPASSQSAAIRVDDRIQTVAEKFFDNGIFPSVVITIGKDPHPDVPGGMRPRLTAQQRRQVIGAIRRTMGSVANYGNPAIVDGLVEAITPLSRTQEELGWDKSEDKIKTRILSAFCVHPFILGEPVGVGGYAQTYVIMERFCDRLNVFLDLLSVLMTHFIQDSKDEEDDSENMLVWWEKKRSSDPSLRWTNLRAARAAGDITKNELRSELGFPPDESEEPLLKAALLPGLSPLITAIGTGLVKPEQLQAVLEGLGVPEVLAIRIACVGMQENQQTDMGQATDALTDAIAALRRIDQKQLVYDVLEKVGV
jgi:phage portal protein BeeE